MRGGVITNIILGFALSFTAGALGASEAGCTGFDDLMGSVNSRLEAAGAGYRLAEVAPLMAYTPDEQRVAAQGGGVWRSTKTPHYGFVPGDLRRGGRTDITYAIENVDLPPNVEAGEVVYAIQRAIDVFDDEPCAPGLVFTEITPGAGTDLGVTEQLLGYGGASGPIADITHAGWLPEPFFDTTAAVGWCHHILGFATTFIFTDAQGQPTDEDNNGQQDVFFREAYYNETFDWSLDYDIFTVALHETGHLLGSHHKAWTFSDDEMVPRHPYRHDDAFLVYHGVHDTLDQKERSEFCHNWMKWPITELGTRNGHP